MKATPVTLRLGNVDPDAFRQFFQDPGARDQYFSPYHARFGNNFGKRKRLKFRGEANNEWFDPSPPAPRAGRLDLTGEEVRRLQTFLRDAGFMPNSNLDGIFGYWTQASVRLFQEYIRTVEGDPDIGKPDGIVGPNTWKFIEAWPAGKVCEWGQAYDAMHRPDSPPSAPGLEVPSAEFQRWMKLVPEVKNYYQNRLRNARPEEINANLWLFQLQEVNKFPIACDTIPIDQWTFDPRDIHLLGIRCNHERGALKRQNDDLFLLLLNGMVFKFWGSTDPNPELAHRGRAKDDEPYLVEGQHKYKFGWHKVSPDRRHGDVVYQALHPYSNGVMVFRDRDNDNALTEEDIRAGLDPSPNTTINIHWSGSGGYNYSAGCQVISGSSYINHRNELVDCTGFAASGYAALGSGTKGAYNVISDLVFVYSPPGTDHVWFTLGQDSTLDLVTPELKADFAHEQVAILTGKS